MKPGFSRSVRWADRFDMEKQKQKNRTESCMEKVEEEDLLPRWSRTQPAPPPTESCSNPASSSPKSRFRNTTTTFFLPAILLAMVLLGFVLGRATTISWIQKREDGGTGLLDLPNDIQKTMRYNRTFSQPPSEESDRAWDELFPPYKGFIQVPLTASHTSEEANRQHHTVGLAAYHELHCLSILRVGFYAALNGTLILNPVTSTSASTDAPAHSSSPSPAMSSESDEETDSSFAEPPPFILIDSTIHDHNKRPDPHHIRHCFDYLRQSLMCLADGNLETVKQDLKGVTGWGERKCRDWAGVERVAREKGGWGL